MNRLQLHLVLYAGVSPEFIDDPDSPHSFNLFIETESTMPLQTSKIKLTPQIGKQIVIKRNTYNQYEHPYSECTVLEDNTLIVQLADRSIFDRVVKTGYAYSRKVCYMVCEQVMITRICGCNSYRLSYQVEGFNSCPYYKNEIIGGGCDTQVDTNFTSILTEFCLPRCPIECHRSFFTTSTSEYTYDKNYFNNYLSNFSFHNDVSKDTDLAQYAYDTMIEIWIEYDTLAFTEMSEEPKMSGEELFGEIGGHLHLFLGMSLMSFMEIFELLAFVAWRITYSFYKRFGGNIYPETTKVYRF